MGPNWILGRLVIFAAICVVLITGCILIEATRFSDDQLARKHCIRVDKNDPEKIVCVCNARHCEDEVFINYESWPTEQYDADVIKSNIEGARFEVSKLAAGKDEPRAQVEVEVEVDLADEHQSIMGWGGAFTDASILNVNSLESAGLADKLIESYFGRFGLHYNLGRVPIAGSDFSTRPYSYNDQGEPTNSSSAADFGQLKWSLAQEDLNLKIPFIKKVSEVMLSHTNDSLRLFGSSWSPPIWLKANHDIKRGHLINSAQVYESYANYTVRFYNAYRERGIKFWGGTVQNEPLSANDANYFFNSLQLTVNETADFVAKYLGPKLEQFGYGVKRKKFALMVGDDNLGLINDYVPAVLASAEVRQFISGLAFHWYATGGQAEHPERQLSYDKLEELHAAIADKVDFFAMTEACNGWILDERHVDLGSWKRGEMYASDIMENLLRHTSAWVDWNLALDREGGPNWVRNYVDAPIIVDGERREFYLQPMYYVLAHFSRLFRRDSIRVGARLAEGSARPQQQQQQRQRQQTPLVVAAHDKRSGHVVVTLLNQLERNMSVAIKLRRAGAQLHRLAPIELERRSLTSVVVKV